MFRKLKSKPGENSLRNIRQRIDEESEIQNVFSNNTRRTSSEEDSTNHITNVSESTSIQVNVPKCTGLSFNEGEGIFCF
jgi:hypothetical protein